MRSHEEVSVNKIPVVSDVLKPFTEVHSSENSSLQSGVGVMQNDFARKSRFIFALDEELKTRLQGKIDLKDLNGVTEIEFVGSDSSQIEESSNKLILPLISDSKGISFLSLVEAGIEPFNKFAMQYSQGWVLLYEALTGAALDAAVRRTGAHGSLRFKIDNRRAIVKCMPDGAIDIETKASHLLADFRHSDIQDLRQFGNLSVVHQAKMHLDDPKIEIEFTIAEGSNPVLAALFQHLTMQALCQPWLTLADRKAIRIGPQDIDAELPVTATSLMDGYIAWLQEKDKKGELPEAVPGQPYNAGSIMQFLVETRGKNLLDKGDTLLKLIINNEDFFAFSLAMQIKPTAFKTFFAKEIRQLNIELLKEYYKCTSYPAITAEERELLIKSLDFLQSDKDVLTWGKIYNRCQEILQEKHKPQEEKQQAKQAKEVLKLLKNEQVMKGPDRLKILGFSPAPCRPNNASY